MLLSALCFTVLNSIIRYVDHLPAFELVFFRSVGSAILAVFMLWKLKINFLGRKHTLLISRAIVGVISMVLYYKAIQMMPLGSAVSLRYLSPIFATVLAIFILKEKVIPVQWVFFAIAFCGVLLIKGFDSRITGLGLLVITTTAFFSGVVYILIRMIGDSEHPIVIVNYFMVISTLVGGTACLFNWVSPEGIEWLYLCSMGVFGFIAQYFMTLAFQKTETNIISPFKYAEAIFTLIAGWLIFGEYQSLIAILGILLIIAALIANVLVKRV